MSGLVQLPRAAPLKMLLKIIEDKDYHNQNFYCKFSVTNFDKTTLITCKVIKERELSEEKTFAFCLLLVIFHFLASVTVVSM